MMVRPVCVASVLLLLALASGASQRTLSTPFGMAPPECVLEVPSGSTVEHVRGVGVAVTHPNGTRTLHGGCADAGWHTAGRKARQQARDREAHERKQLAAAGAPVGDFPGHLWLCTMLGDTTDPQVRYLCLAAALGVLARSTDPQLDGDVVALNATWLVPDFPADSGQTGEALVCASRKRPSLRCSRWARRVRNSLHLDRRAGRGAVRRRGERAPARPGTP
jgi:hypothetical protein